MLSPEEDVALGDSTCCAPSGGLPLSWSCGVSAGDGIACGSVARPSGAYVSGRRSIGHGSVATVEPGASIAVSSLPRRIGCASTASSGDSGAASGLSGCVIPSRSSLASKDMFDQ